MRRILFLILLIVFFFIGNIFSLIYEINKRPVNICMSDLDNDGDLDMLIGHRIYGEDYWRGLTIMYNDGNGYFSLQDTIYFERAFSYFNVGKFRRKRIPRYFWFLWTNRAGI